MGEKRSVGKLLKETATFTAVAYAAYSGLSALVDSNGTFIDKIKDPETMVSVSGLGIGYLIYSGVSELVKRYNYKRE